MVVSYKLVNTIAECQETVRKLMITTEVAMDIEGVDLGRNGRISIIQAYPKEGNVVYLFDIKELRGSAFEAGGLREFLQSGRVLKVIYDGRGDNDALWHLYRVKTNNVYDVQVLYTFKFNRIDDKYLKGLKVALEKYGVSNEEKRIKLDGKRLFEPDHGGSFEVWEKRPLAEALMKYASVDVTYLIRMKDRWGNSAMDDNVKRTGAERIATATNAFYASEGSGKALVDFSYQGFGLPPLKRENQKPENEFEHEEKRPLSFWDAYSPQDFGFDSIWEAEMAGV